MGGCAWHPENERPLPKKVLVLGAGCAGLAAAWRLSKKGYDVELFEQANRVGGLAGGVEINGNVYEYGPHAFHTTDPEILGDIKSLMGEELISYKRTIKIKFFGSYFDFPLSIHEVIFKLPFFTVVKAFLSLIWHSIKSLFWKPKVENSETLLIRYYGKVLYELFFKDYIFRVWGIPASEFSPSFARQRIPRLDLLKVIEKAIVPIKNRFHKQVNTQHYVEKVEGNLYTTKRGFSLITERMAEAVQKNGGGIRLRNRVMRILRDGPKMEAVEVQDESGAIKVLSCDGLINTLPLNEAILMTEPSYDGAILQAANHLKFRAVVFVGLVVNRPKLLMTSFMYFREHSFNRLTDLSQFGFKIEPKGCTIVVGEISCDAQDRYWKDNAYASQAVIQDLEREGILSREEILHVHVFRARHAYPIYTLHYEDALKVLLQTVADSANFETAGRQGRFQYINTHIAMKMGYEAADRLAAKIGGLHAPDAKEAGKEALAHST